jgi:hypothetical protein
MKLIDFVLSILIADTNKREMDLFIPAKVTREYIEIRYHDGELVLLGQNRWFWGLLSCFTDTDLHEMASLQENFGIKINDFTELINNTQSVDNLAVLVCLFYRQTGMEIDLGQNILINNFYEVSRQSRNDYIFDGIMSLNEIKRLYLELSGLQIDEPIEFDLDEEFYKTIHLASDFSNCLFSAIVEITNIPLYDESKIREIFKIVQIFKIDNKQKMFLFMLLIIEFKIQ